MYNCCIFFLDWSSDHYVVSFFVSFHGLYFKLHLFDMSIAIPAFFWSPFVWNIFFQPFTFSLYVSLVLRRVAFRKHIEVLFLYPFSQFYLLVGTLESFIFKVIIDKYDPIAIYFIVLGLSLYSLFVFPV